MIVVKRSSKREVVGQILAQSYDDVSEKIATFLRGCNNMMLDACLASSRALLQTWNYLHERCSQLLSTYNIARKSGWPCSQIDVEPFFHPEQVAIAPRAQPENWPQLRQHQTELKLWKKSFSKSRQCTSKIQFVGNLSTGYFAKGPCAHASIWEHSNLVIPNPLKSFPLLLRG